MKKPTFAFSSCILTFILGLSLSLSGCGKNHPEAGSVQAEQDPVIATAGLGSLSLDGGNLSPELKEHVNKAMLALPSVVAECGAVLTQSTTLQADLDCTDFEGVALSLRGDNLTLNGNGFKILAPKALAGLLIIGSSNTVKNINVSNNSKGWGLLAYDSPQLSLLNSTFDNDWMGINIYQEQRAVGGVTVSGNSAKNAGLFALRVNSAGPTRPSGFVIQNNDFSGAKGYAMHLSMATHAMSGADNNKIDNSLNGVFLTGGTFSVQDWDLSAAGIPQIKLFAAYVATLSLQNLNLTGRAPQDAAYAGFRFGAHLYNIQNAAIQRVIADKNDVGLRLALDGGTPCAVTVEHSEFSSNIVAGIQVKAYDSTSFGMLDIRNNDLRLNPAGMGLKIYDGTTYASGSRLSPNQL